MGPAEPPSELETQNSLGCLTRLLRFGFWFWCWLYGYVTLALVFAYATRPILGDEFMNREGFLVALMAMIVTGVPVILGSRRWRVLDSRLLVVVNVVGVAGNVLLVATR